MLGLGLRRRILLALVFPLNISVRFEQLRRSRSNLRSAQSQASEATDQSTRAISLRSAEHALSMVDLCFDLSLSMTGTRWMASTVPGP